MVQVCTLSVPCHMSSAVDLYTRAGPQKHHCDEPAAGRGGQPHGDHGGEHPRRGRNDHARRRGAKRLHILTSKWVASTLPAPNCVRRTRMLGDQQPHGEYPFPAGEHDLIALGYAWQLRQSCSQTSSRWPPPPNSKQRPCAMRSNVIYGLRMKAL